MRIALDAMGGDHGPEQTVKGAVDFLREVADRDVGVILVGDRAALETEAARHNYDSHRLEINHASQLVDQDEKPSRIVKTKPDSSLVRAVQLVKEGTAQGIVSAGSTGALLSASLFLLDRIPGVRRPAICTWFPSAKGGFLLCDVGANVNVRATDLVQFAIMARAYCQHQLNHPNPRIGLVNIGTEASKGNEVTVKAYQLLSVQVDNFVGNIEARDLFEGHADVVVCDGFVGNILLKFTEGLVQHLYGWARQTVRRHWTSQLALPLLRPALVDLTQQLDYAETGGSPLLGLNGVSIVSHGLSSAKAIKNALKTAHRCVTEELISSITKGITDHHNRFEEHNAVKES
ncbi:MAG: phosphate acyltransferase PlsX [Candidatus Marinimicrobia bacterium]|nr:phosphate acyltransferase PlsX [Candidatus Neomarinimicrobiota bacterium]